MAKRRSKKPRRITDGEAPPSGQVRVPEVVWTPGGNGGSKTKYLPEYCAALVEHMKTGGKSFHSFGAVVGVHWDTLYEWARAHPEFDDAWALGEVHSLAFWEGVERAGITGNLRRVVKETVRIVNTPDGKQEQVLDREFAPAAFYPVAYIFKMKNAFPELYRDKKTLELPPGSGMPLKDMTDEQVKRTLRDALGRLAASITDDDPAAGG